MNREKRLWPFFAVLVPAFCALAVVIYVGTRPSEKDEEEPRRRAPLPSEIAKASELSKTELAAVRVEVDQFCGDCHLTPQPHEFPKSAWKSEVERGFDFYVKSGRNDLLVPDGGKVVQYYEHFAPRDEEFYAALRSAESSPVDLPPFVRSGNLTPFMGPKHGVASVIWDEDYDGESDRLLYCDMETGDVIAIDPRRLNDEPTVLANVGYATHIEATDLDRDGHRDYVVTNIGGTVVRDFLGGSVVWLRNSGNHTDYEPITIRGDLARACDVSVADFDGDSDLDLIVAEFGYFKTGRILLLENVSLEPVRFRPHILDQRAGAVNVVPADLDADGDQDFLAVVGQEFETVDAFINNGKAEFERTHLYEASTPGYGSSSIEWVDLDQDGDRDILYTNGDSFDGPIPKPYHSIQWLRNDGDLNFSHHHIAHMPGVLKALPLDIDSDGDLDLAAVAMMPTSGPIDRVESKIDSIACWINDGDQSFQRVSLESRNLAHACCVAGDFDGDGDPDLAIGNFSEFSRVGKLPQVDIWFNRYDEAEASPSP